MFILFALACGPVDVPSKDRAGETDLPADSDGSDTDPAVDTEPVDPPPCPADMVLTGGFCIDIAEAALEEQVGGSWQVASPFLTIGERTVRAISGFGRLPQAYISGDQAAAACAASSKRLCTSEEWLSACQGPSAWTWPYGPIYDPEACHTSYDGGHPVIDFFGTSEGIWDGAHMNDPGIDQQPGTLAVGGSYAACHTPTGIYDLHGNLHEWVDDAAGTFRGGFFADASINGQGCLYVTTAHTTTYHDYSTGFRCCADPR